MAQTSGPSGGGTGAASASAAGAQNAGSASEMGGGGGGDFYDSSVHWMRLGYPDYQTWVKAGMPSKASEAYDPNKNYNNNSGGGGGNGNRGKNKTGRIRYTGDDLEDAWQPGADEATDIYNTLGRQNREYDQDDYLGGTMDSLMGMQNPEMNPYLDQMYNVGAENLRNEMFNSLGSSGRGRPIYDESGGNDVFANYVDSLSNFGTQFYGNAYNQDMDRKLGASQTMMSAAPGVLNDEYNRPWNDINQYSDVVSQLTGTASREPADPGGGGSSDLLATVGTGLAAYAAFASSKDAKSKVRDETGALDKMMTLDVDRWKYNPGEGDGGVHAGPYAEDFHEAFGLGDGESINPIDAIGVQFASLQELAEEVEKLRAQLGAKA